jgi:hypothetical protein
MALYTANVWGNLLGDGGGGEEPFIRKTGDTASGLLIFDGGLETNVGQATFNGPVEMTDELVITSSGDVAIDAPTTFTGASTTITGGIFQVDVPATFNNVVTYNDTIEFNNDVTLDADVVLTPTATLNVDCVSTFSVAATFGASPDLNQTVTGVALISQDIPNGKVSSVTASAMQFSDQIASVVSKNLNATSSGITIQDFTTAKTCSISTNSINIQDTSIPQHYVKVDEDELRVNWSSTTYAAVSSVGGNVRFDAYTNEPGGTNYQVNVDPTGIGCQDNTNGSLGAINSGGFCTLLSKSTGPTQPMLQLKNNLNSAAGVTMETYKEKSVAGVIGDELFRLSMFGKNSGNTKEEYGRITCNIRDPSGSGAGADGQLLLAVPVNDVMTTFIDINGNSNQLKIYKPLVFSDNTIQTTAYTGGGTFTWADGTVQNSAFTGWTGINATYANPTITFNTQGEITNITSGSIGSFVTIALGAAPVAPTGTTVAITALNVLPARQYMIYGCVGIATQDGTGTIANATLNVEFDGVIVANFITGASNTYILSINVPPVIVFGNASKTLRFTTTVNTTLGNNYTFSTNSINSRFYAVALN